MLGFLAEFAQEAVPLGAGPFDVRAANADAFGGLVNFSAGFTNSTTNFFTFGNGTDFAIDPRFATSGFIGELTGQIESVLAVSAGLNIASTALSAQGSLASGLAAGGGSPFAGLTANLGRRFFFGSGGAAIGGGVEATLNPEADARSITGAALGGFTT
ncbi:MAG TPA: hypothetical protein ENH15_02975, partial [Actinobacteria bacterium]|nr:hypothetical protein [Actinomycetota bacterium]